MIRAGNFEKRVASTHQVATNATFQDRGAVVDGLTQSWYDANGFLSNTNQSSSDGAFDAAAFNRTFVNDAQGQSIYLNQGAQGGAGAGRIQHFNTYLRGSTGTALNPGHVQHQLIVNGEVIGRYEQQQTGVDESGEPVYAQVAVTTRSSGYDAAGNLRFTHSVSGSSQGSITTDTEITLRTLEGYQQQSTYTLNTNLDSGKTTEGTVSLYYSANNQLVGVDDSTSAVSNRRLVNDVAGHVLLNTQGNPEVGVHRLRELVVAGQVMGVYGSGVDRSNPQDADGHPMFTEQGDFNPAYRPVTGSYPAAATGQYPVRAGDTLRSIAQAAYGDADLWYEIAQANGVSGDAQLRVGQVLNIPAKVGAVHNTASTYAPWWLPRCSGALSIALSTSADRRIVGKVLPMNTAISPTPVKLNPELKMRLKRLAAARHRAPHWLMREAIAQYVDREEKRQTLHQAAVAAWAEFEETGLHVSGNEVMDWLETWGTDDERPAPACHR